MRQFLTNYRYELITAVSGGAVLTLELVGARMVAPYFGTSIYIWTSMIGVILGSLSLGYWYGGRLADKGATDNCLMKTIALSAVAILLAVLIQEPVLQFVSSSMLDVRLQSIIAATILFAPASTALGIVSPYVAKLRLSSLKTAGASIGRLYAAGTLGSIVGTFASGYFLIALFGNRSLGLGIVIILVVLSFWASQTDWLKRRLALLLGSAVFLILPTSPGFGVIADVDTPYNRYLVLEQKDINGTLRSLVTDGGGTQSAHYMGDPLSLPLDYTQRFKEVTNGYNNPSSALVIGGGAFSFPSYLARAYPTLQVDAVEIDPDLVPLSKKYFELEDHSNLSIFNDDGRIYLNRNTSKYDLMFIDAYSSLTPPYQLATKEAVEVMKSRLNPDGILAVNLIARLDDDPYLNATVATYRSVFDNVLIFNDNPGNPPSSRQNLLLLMGQRETTVQKVLAGVKGERVSVDSHNSPLLTDDFAPVEQLIAR